VSRIVVIGVPRSGTTWVSTILSTAPGTVLINEPDYPESYLSGGLAVDEYGLYPVIGMGASASPYEMIWDVAFSGGFPGRAMTRRIGRMLVAMPPKIIQPFVRTAARIVPRIRTSPEHCVVKTVNAQFAIDWIAERYHPTVIVVRRNLLSVIGSWLQMGFIPYAITTPFELSEHPEIRREFLEPLSLHPPSRDAPLIKRIAWHVGLLSIGLERAVARHPEWIVLDHEDLCKSPIECFRALFSEAGLTWTDDVERELHRLDRPGSGLNVQRVAREQIDSWKTSLSPEQAADAMGILRRFSEPAAMGY
jgi:hypothetical protein